MNKGTKIFLFIAIPVIIILMIAGAAIAILPSSAAGLNLSAKLSELVGIVQVRDNPQANYNPVDAGFILKKSHAATDERKKQGAP